MPVAAWPHRPAHPAAPLPGRRLRPLRRLQDHRHRPLRPQLAAGRDRPRLAGRRARMGRDGDQAGAERRVEADRFRLLHLRAPLQAGDLGDLPGLEAAATAAADGALPARDERRQRRLPRPLPDGRGARGDDPGHLAPARAAAAGPRPACRRTPTASSAPTPTASERSERPEAEALRADRLTVAAVADGPPQQRDQADQDRPEGDQRRQPAGGPGDRQSGDDDGVNREQGREQNRPQLRPGELVGPRTRCARPRVARSARRRRAGPSSSAPAPSARS